MKFEYNKNSRYINLLLKKEKIKGLFAIGISTLLLTSCSVEKKFEYDQSINTSLSEQYQEFSNKKLDSNINIKLNQLRPYEISVDEYNDLLSIDASREDKVLARVEVINDVKSLINAAYAIIEIKITKKLELTDTANFEYINNGNSVDGPNYIIKITDDGKKYEINSIPIKMSKILNLIDTIKSYKGTGKSEAWDKDIDGYIERTEELYYLTLEVASDSFDKIKAKEIETKKIGK